MLQKSLQMYEFLPKQPKENTEKITNLSHFLVFGLVIECRNGNEAAYGERHAT